MNNKTSTFASKQPKMGHWTLYIPAFFYILLGITSFFLPGSALVPPYSGTQLLFLFTGLAFLFQTFKWIFAVRVLSGILMIFSCLILLQEQFSWPIFSIFKNVSAVSSFCFALVNLTLLVITDKQRFPWNNAAALALGTLIFVIAAIALVGNVYGIDRTAGLFLMNHVLSVAFMVAGLCLIAHSWETLKSDPQKNEIPWYMIPRNICILTAALTYVLLIVAYPSFQKEPNVRPEELLTILLLTGIVYYLRQAHQRSEELEHTVEQLNSARDSLVNQEKLASLGVLVAGIAHEIKNPLNFIYNFSDLSASMIEDIKKDFDHHKDAFPIDKWRNSKKILRF
ncbi:MAG: hypothetical protein H0U49_07810 [Parachlamydiaceae bacterium]|nr:hypothetical protein [Parachlamydiaceae bacterium]